VIVTQRKRLTRWSQKGTGYDAGSHRSDQQALSRNPVDSVALKVQTMEMGNGVTPSGSLWNRSAHGVGANRMRLGRRMPEEAKAWGNTQDMLTSGR
jgi:hypothetical protein